MWAWCPPDDAARRVLDALFGRDAGATGAAGGYGTAGGGLGAGGREAAPPPGRSGDAFARTFPLPSFQEAAVTRLRPILARRGGAILADAVGLGKTYVSLALIEERLRTGHGAVVVVPAATRSLWRGPLRRVERRAGGGASCRVVSHTKLSRGAAVRPLSGGGLVVVDEAHRFRNPDTRRYGALARLLAGGETCTDAGVRPDVLLVTATPVNNSLDDLYHLLRLFLADAGLRDVGVPSLRAVFEVPGPDPAGIRAAVREVVVRRSRRMVEERFGSPAVDGVGAGAERRAAAGGENSPGRGTRFPDRAAPVIHRYRDASLARCVEAIETLELAVYAGGAGPLVRLGLLKRLDSSRAAFVTSLRRLRELLRAAADAADAGRLLRPDDRLAAGDADPFQLILVGVLAGPAPPELDLEALAASTRRDLGVVDALLRGLSWSDLSTAAGLARPPNRPPTPPQTRTGSASDPTEPKAAALLTLLRERPDERVLVFTEYRDTAESLWRALAAHVRVARIDGSGAWLGGSPAGRRRVVERFAPVANRRRPGPDRERVDVLVATDVLAEGLNLQDARHVVSYDLPWNPVRLLQRIGRVDRLGSRHDTVVPHLFVPADGLDRVLQLTRRLRTKLHGIALAVGGSQADELLQGLVAGSPARVESALRSVENREHTDPWEQLRTLWLRVGRPLSAPTPTASWYGEVVVEGSGADDDVAAVVLVDWRSELLELSRDGALGPLTTAGVRVIRAALEDAAGARAARPGELPGSGGPAPTVHRELDAVRRRVRRHLQRQRTAGESPAPLGRSDPAARLARLVRTALAGAGSGLDPEIVSRAERILETLNTPLSPLQERAAKRLLRGASVYTEGEECDPVATLDAVDETLRLQGPVLQLRAGERDDRHRRGFPSRSPPRSSSRSSPHIDPDANAVLGVLFVAPKAG